jgi:uncharacterized repeat protein (TIGR01451 family)
LGGIVVAGMLIGLVGASSAAAGSAGQRSTVLRPVPSLTPVATQRLWSELVRGRRAHAFRAAAACQPLRAIFYAPTDWRRLTTRLAANASPCAAYYISVPPQTNDKTQLRADEAWRIRALGPAFHALAEISVTGWTSWVAIPGNSWFAAGVEARRRMAAAGYDVAAGDTWALNELSSAVRQGTGNARANMRAFLKGLHDGDGVLPPARGTVFVAGIGQTTGDLSVYQARLQEWYEDAAFWNELSLYASDWSQEVYGDVRNYAVAGLTREARRDSLNEYLQHQASLAGAAPAAGAAAQAFLAAADSPLANAAWRYDAAFGWTDVPVELMQDYVSAQTYATRSAGNSRFGFAWSPRNLAGIPTAEFNAQTDALLVRLAAAIADSSEAPEAACGSAWCDRSLDGAAVTTAWRTFAAWKPSVLAFTTPAQTLSPGAPSSPITLELRTSSGTAYTAGLPVTVELSSSSPTGELSTSSGGPWTATLSTSIASGQSVTSVYFRDAQSGSPTITAAAAGKTAATQTVTVAAPADTTPPETTLDSAPTGTIASSAASMSFTANEPGARFECSLDGAPFTACTSPASYGGLADGAHSFDVRAIDAAGNLDSSPAHATWTVETFTSPPAPTPPAPAPPSSSGSGGAAPDLLTQASATPTAPTIGTTVTYLISVRNLGGSASQALVTVQLPPQAAYAASQSDRGPGCTGTTTLTCDLDFLAGNGVATVRIQATVRQAGTLTLTATSSAQPGDAQPANDTATAVITVLGAPAAAPRPPADAAPTLRHIGTTPAVTRHGATTHVSIRFWVSERARLQARVTPLRSTRAIQLRPGTSLAGTRMTTIRPTATATVSRSGTYALQARLPAARLLRGRTYLLRFTATDTSGQQRTLTIRLQA